jgi:hypothetical protein
VSLLSTVLVLQIIQLLLKIESKVKDWPTGNELKIESMEHYKTKQITPILILLLFFIIPPLSVICTIAENVETFYDKIFTSDQQKAKLLKLLFAQILLLVIVVILNAG